MQIDPILDKKIEDTFLAHDYILRMWDKSKKDGEYDLSIVAKMKAMIEHLSPATTINEHEAQDEILIVLAEMLGEGLEPPDSVDTDPISFYNTDLAITPQLVKPDGTLLKGTGNPSKDFRTAGNNELGLGIAIRKWNDAKTIPSDSQGHYDILLEENERWIFLYTIAIDTELKADILDLYDIKLEIESQGFTLPFELVRELDKYAVINREHGFKILDGFTSEDAKVFQDIRRVSYYSKYFPETIPHENGVPIGDYKFTITGTRKHLTTDRVINPVVCIATTSIAFVQVPASHTVKANFNDGSHLLELSLVDDKNVKQNLKILPTNRGVMKKGGTYKIVIKTDPIPYDILSIKINGVDQDLNGDPDSFEAVLSYEQTVIDIETTDIFG